MENEFITSLNKEVTTNSDESAFDNIWKRYENIIVQSIVTSFGLDFITNDRYGGDVDTIHNVRKFENDVNMTYKNVNNAKAYDEREEYDTAAYHTDSGFMRIKREARNNFDNKGIMLDDEYVNGNKLIPRNNKTIERTHQGQLDHVVSTHEMHDDRGRMLAKLNGLELANNPRNLRFTNAALNLNKSDMTVEEYIQWCEDNPSKVNCNGKKGEALPDELKSKLKEEYKRAKTEDDKRLNQAYYTSKEFRNDTFQVASLRGA